MAQIRWSNIPKMFRDNLVRMSAYRSPDDVDYQVMLHMTRTIKAAPPSQRAPARNSCLGVFDQVVVSTDPARLRWAK